MHIKTAEESKRITNSYNAKIPEKVLRHVYLLIVLARKRGAYSCRVRYPLEYPLLNNAVNYVTQTLRNAGYDVKVITDLAGGHHATLPFKTFVISWESIE